MHLLLKTVNYVQWYPYLPSISKLACREGFLLNCYIVQWGKTDSCLRDSPISCQMGWLNFWLMIILHVLVDICYIWWFRISWILRLEFMKVKAESGLLEMPWISLPIVWYYIIVSNWQFAKSDDVPVQIHCGLSHRLHRSTCSSVVGGQYSHLGFDG